MRIPIITFLFILAFPLLSSAGEIYGLIRGVSEAPVQITGSSEFPYSTKTDEKGIYRIYIQETGPCQLKVQVKKEWIGPIEVYSYKKPIRYNLAIEGSGKHARLLRE